MRKFLAAFFAVALATAAHATITITNTGSAAVFPNVCLNDAYHVCIQTEAASAYGTTGNGEFLRNNIAGPSHAAPGFTLGNEMGWITFQSGTGNGTTGIVDLRTGTNQLAFGNGVSHFFARIRSGAAVSNGTDRYMNRVGFMDGGSTATDATDGCEFLYSDNLNSGKWQAVCIAAGVQGTPADTGITYAINTVRTMEITVDAAAANAVFKIDGAQVAAVTTGIPGTTAPTGCGVASNKSLGTTDTTVMSVARVSCQIDLTSPRW